MDRYEIFCNRKQRAHGGDPTPLFVRRAELKIFECASIGGMNYFLCVGQVL